MLLNVLLNNNLTNITSTIKPDTMKNILQKGLLLAVTAVMLLPTYVLAGGGPGFSLDVDDGCEVPLDGGMGFLAAAGVGYAIKLAANYRKRKAEATQ
jgi:hypothetical protein